MLSIVVLLSFSYNPKAGEKMTNKFRQFFNKWGGSPWLTLVVIVIIVVIYLLVRPFAACQEFGFYDLTWSPGAQIAYNRVNYFCPYVFCPNTHTVFTVDEASHEKEIKSSPLGKFGLGWLPDGQHLVLSAGYGFSAGQSSKCSFAVFDIGNATLKCLNQTYPLGEAALSPDGTRIAFFSLDSILNIMESDGSNVKRLPYIEGGTINESLSWSPDSKFIAYVTANGGDAIYSVKSDGTSPQRLTKDSYDNWDPKWSPDGSRIAFLSRRGGYMGGPTPAGICGSLTNCGYPKTYTMKSDGTDVKLLIDSPGDDGEAKWSPDGSRLVLVSNRDGNHEIYIVNPDGTNLIRLTNNRGEDSSPVWSPDGARIAFVSTRNGYSNIFVMNADGTNEVQLTLNPPNAPCLHIL
jgi:TolB protein